MSAHLVHAGYCLIRYSEAHLVRAVVDNALLLQVFIIAVDVYLLVHLVVCFLGSVSHDVLHVGKAYLSV